jgi:hypothetical protein
MTDFMNVWTMLWLNGMAQYSQDMLFLNIDGLEGDESRLSLFYYDEPNQFFEHYKNNFAGIIKGIDFGTSKVCFKKLLMQPMPVIHFTYDYWHHDNPCSLIGPSTLFQRWNLQIRQMYNLLDKDALLTNHRWQILLIVRRAESVHKFFSSRVFSNDWEIAQILHALPNVKIVVQDLGELSFYEQVKLIHQSSIIIGMHGAGIASTMHMAIGTKYCCGLLEVYPTGIFSPMRGHGNMARRMRIHYRRIDVPIEATVRNGTIAPVVEILHLVTNLMLKIERNASCIMPSTIDNPFFLFN